MRVKKLTIGSESNEVRMLVEGGVELKKWGLQWRFEEEDGWLHDR